MSRPLPVLLGGDPRAPFPDPMTALREPEGLLAVGGDLEPERLLAAYANGIFPWFSEGQPPLWWSPDPRTVFPTAGMHLPRRFRRQLRASGWSVTADLAFDEVMHACATVPRAGQDGTWITPAMRAAYGRLHLLGHAHSIEVRDAEGTVVGGLYGVARGRMFYGESMFSRASGASRFALAALAHVLADWGWPLIDAQVDNPHLAGLGAQSWPRPRFLAEVRRLVAMPGRVGSWAGPFGRVAAAEVVPPRPGADPCAG